MSEHRTVFVTVGTTKFDDLVKAVDSLEFAEIAMKKGYSHLVVQRGAGSYEPHNLVKQGEECATLNSGLEVRFFQYSPSLKDNMEKAALVISHAGSGSIFEALSYSKPLIVVPNAQLMDNHQAELGEHLAGMQHLVCSTTKGLIDAVANLDVSKLKPYLKGSTSTAAGSGIVAEINKWPGRQFFQDQDLLGQGVVSGLEDWKSDFLGCVLILNGPVSPSVSGISSNWLWLNNVSLIDATGGI